MMGKKDNFLCEKTFQDFLIAKEKRIWRHATLLALLLLQFAPEVIFIFTSYSEYELVKAHQIALLECAIIFCASILIYINLLWLVPTFLLRKKYPLYFTLTACELAIDFIITLSLQFALAKMISSKPIGYEYVWSVLLSPANVIQSVTLPTVFLGSIVGILLFRQWLVREQAIKELQEVQLKTELSQLKSQINPHFLFNTLNNINSLIHIDPNKASQIVMGLSDVLRYNLYESNHDRVSLKKEIEVHAHILELEKIRRKEFECGITHEGDCTSAYVPPFLFINFIENAIKHSADDRGKSFIAVNFHRQDKSIDFKCTNSIANGRKNTSGGLGLANVKRRLELLYGNDFLLTTARHENEFSVTLSLPL
jgi:sensor histidine kinase YesM